MCQVVGCSHPLTALSEEFVRVGEEPRAAGEVRFCEEGTVDDAQLSSVFCKARKGFKPMESVAYRLIHAWDVPATEHHFDNSAWCAEPYWAVTDNVLKQHLQRLPRRWIHKHSGCLKFSLSSDSSRVPVGIQLSGPCHDGRLKAAPRESLPSSWRPRPLPLPKKVKGALRLPGSQCCEAGVQAGLKVKSVGGQRALSGGEHAAWNRLEILLDQGREAGGQAQPWCRLGSHGRAGISITAPAVSVGG
jgi:hypothetical protein